MIRARDLIAALGLSASLFPEVRPSGSRLGALTTEMAERTGLHPSSVRRILYDLARRLALAERPEVA